MKEIESRHLRAGDKFQLGTSKDALMFVVTEAEGGIITYMVAHGGDAKRIVKSRKVYAVEFAMPPSKPAATPVERTAESIRKRKSDRRKRHHIAARQRRAAKVA